MVMENSIFVLKQQDYCSVGYAITSVRKIILFMLCCNG